MNSEKVKEIKKALGDNANYEHYNKLGFIDGYKCKTVAYADILTYINELESENERLVESCKNCHYIKDIEIANGHTKELKDRIAELEKKNEKLLDSVETVQNDRCVFKCELTKKQLKQFAERVKEKYGKSCSEYYPLLLKLTSEQLDETLKEFINE